MQQDTIAKPHQQYLKALKKWDKNSHSTTEGKNTQNYSKKYLLKYFALYRPITLRLTPQHANWQIDTTEKLLQRSEPFETISNLIQIQKPKPCNACDRKIHAQWNCPKVKKQAQLRRYKLSRNERKDNQVGDYACRKPFQLLKDTLIPQQVFDLYEKEFIPFYCE